MFHSSRATRYHRQNKTTGHILEYSGAVSAASNKTTGHIAWLTAVALVLALTLSFVTPARAAQVTFTTSNDPVNGNARPDDLYTAEVGLDVRLKDQDVSFGERMFTDHERGIRFDETSVEVSHPLTRFAGWGGEAGLGVLHVGRGLLGQRAQNEVHRIVGSDREDLVYAADHRLYPLARLVLARPLPVSSNLGSVTARIEAVAVPGFHSSLRAGFVTERTVGGVDLLAGVAGVLHDVDSDLLGGVISPSGVAWDLGVGWHNVFLLLSDNAYGTEARHLTVGYRFQARDFGRLVKPR